MGNKRWILTTITLILVIGFTAFIFLQKGADKRIVEQILPRVEAKFGVDIAYDDVSVSLTSVSFKKVVVSERGSGDTFCKLSRLLVNVRVGPLLMNEVDITGIRVEGLKLVAGEEAKGASLESWRKLTDRVKREKDKPVNPKEPLISIPDIRLTDGIAIFGESGISLRVEGIDGRVTLGDKAAVNTGKWQLVGMDAVTVSGEELEAIYDFQVNHVKATASRDSHTQFEVSAKIEDMVALQEQLRIMWQAFDSPEQPLEKGHPDSVRFFDGVFKVYGARGTIAAPKKGKLVSFEKVNAELATGKTKLLSVRASGIADGADEDWGLQGTVPRDGTPVLLLEVPKMSIAQLGEYYLGSDFTDWGRAFSGLQLKIEHGADGNQTEVSGQFHLFGLTLSHERIAADPIDDLGFSADFKLTLDHENKVYTLNNCAISRDLARVNLKGEVNLPKLTFDLNVAAPPVACRHFLGAFPEVLRPQLQDVKLDGQIDVSLGVHVDMTDPEKFDLTGDLNNKCRIIDFGKVPRPDSFRRPFAYLAYGPDDDLIRLTTGPGSDRWTPITGISPFLYKALFTTEDGKFRHHKGMTLPEMKSAIVKNIKKGGFFLGASTITMQLAKNLFLTRDRTIARKLQELFFTWYLETEFTKDEILELYFNVVEFGPAIYGIGEASMLYFGRHPRELNLAESVFLIKLLPNPVDRFKWYEKDGLGERQMKMLHRVMATMLDRNHITQAQYKEGLGQKIEFYREGDPLPVPRTPVVDDGPPQLEGGVDTGGEIPVYQEVIQ